MVCSHDDPSSRGDQVQALPVDDDLHDRVSGGPGDLDQSRSLTAEDLHAAIRKAEERDQSEAEERGRRIKAFFSEIPEALHRNEYVTLAAAYIAEGQPMHPKDHAFLTGKIAEVLREHEGRQTLWVPGRG